jgi:hypothetical protein
MQAIMQAITNITSQEIMHIPMLMLKTKELWMRMIFAYIVLSLYQKSKIKPIACLVAGVYLLMLVIQMDNIILSKKQPASHQSYDNEAHRNIYTPASELDFGEY